MNPNGVSRLRLNLMRAMYLVMFVGTLFTQGPTIIHHAASIALMHGVASSLLMAMAAIALLGVRYPLQLVPLLLFELLWKSIWLLAFALPLWTARQMDADTMESVKACLMGVVLCPLVIPWGYVWDTFVRRPADR